MLFTKQHIIKQIKQNKQHITRLGVRSIGLFGSYARNQQKPTSDIDIFVDFIPEYETFDNFMELCFLFDDMFTDTKVEVVTRNGLSPIIGPKILKEVEYVEISD